MLAIFGLFMAWAYNAPFMVWVFGFMSLSIYPITLPIFCFLISIFYDAPWWIYVIGILCLMIDSAEF